MAQRSVHYEQAFEHYLRANRIPYVAVDEARKALAPPTIELVTHAPSLMGPSTAAPDVPAPPTALKSFDFVVSAPDRSLLIDVKGRAFGSATAAALGRTTCGGRYETWVTLDDIDSLTHWQRLFGPSFEAMFVFAYALRQQPPDALFEEVFEFRGRWYALREIRLDDYRRFMVPRSAKWRTVHLPAADAARISRPLTLRPQSAPRQAAGR